MAKKKLTVDRWVKETTKRYGVETVLKYPWETLFLTQSYLKDQKKV